MAMKGPKDKDTGNSHEDIKNSLAIAPHPHTSPEAVLELARRVSTEATLALSEGADPRLRYEKRVIAAADADFVTEEKSFLPDDPYERFQAFTAQITVAQMKKGGIELEARDYFEALLFEAYRHRCPDEIRRALCVKKYEPLNYMDSEKRATPLNMDFMERLKEGLKDVKVIKLPDGMRTCLVANSKGKLRTVEEYLKSSLPELKLEETLEPLRKDLPKVLQEGKDSLTKQTQEISPLRRALYYEHGPEYLCEPDNVSEMREKEGVIIIKRASEARYPDYKKQNWSEFHCASFPSHSYHEGAVEFYTFNREHIDEYVRFVKGDPRYRKADWHLERCTHVIPKRELYGKIIKGFCLGFEKEVWGSGTIYDSGSSGYSPNLSYSMVEDFGHYYKHFGQSMYQAPEWKSGIYHIANEIAPAKEVQIYIVKNDDSYECS